MRVTGYIIGEDEFCCECARCEAGGDEFPEGAMPIFGWSEYDCPPHCCKCEALIVVTLTTDGLAYIADKFAGHFLMGDGRPCILAAWWDRWSGALRADYKPEQFAAMCAHFNAAPMRDEFSPAR